jgi:hypothetical protein
LLRHIWQVLRIKFAKVERTKMTKSKVKIRGADSGDARAIKKGDKVLNLRNRRDIPEWSRGAGRVGNQHYPRQVGHFSE